MRRLPLQPLLLLLPLVLLTATCIREAPAKPNLVLDLHFVPEPLPPPELLAEYLGPFRLEGAWRMASGHTWFGSFSGLTTVSPGRLLSVTDRGYALWFAPPGAAVSAPRITAIRPRPLASKSSNDAEAVTSDARTGRLWIGWEATNAISGHAADLRERGTVRPKPMRTWGVNSGPEAVVRLSDGRFIALREAANSRFRGTDHQAVLFSGDPLLKPTLTEFTFVGSTGFEPTDMVEIPDGRVLILMRRLVWPFPPRFSGLLMLADPRRIVAGGQWTGRIVARLDASLDVDNFEGIAVEPRADGRLTVWLISDDNSAVTQRSLLWKLTVDPHGFPATP